MIRYKKGNIIQNDQGTCILYEREIYMKLILIVIIGMTLFGCQKNIKEPQSLRLFIGAASKPPTEEINQLFEKETGIKLEANFGGSGVMLSQMLLTESGDIYFPGSSDFMEIATNKNVIFPETEKRVVYLVSAINVQKGNPKNIQSLRDLTQSKLKVSIGHPETVCVGTYAVEIVESQLSPKEKELFKINLVTYAESCEKTAGLISLQAVDAVIGWSVFQHWNPDVIETIKLPASQLSRVGYISIAISQYSKQKELAQKYIDFVLSEKGKNIFKKHHYFVTEQEAFDYIGEVKPVGGFYELPIEWKLSNK